MINIAPLFSHVHTVGAACERKACDQLAKVVVGCLFSFLSNYFILLYGDPFIHLFHLCFQNLALNIKRNSYYKTKKKTENHQL